MYGTSWAGKKNSTSTCPGKENKSSVNRATKDGAESGQIKGLTKVPSHDPLTADGSVKVKNKSLSDFPMTIINVITV